MDTDEAIALILSFVSGLCIGGATALFVYATIM
jgi:hypothetical protein